MFRVFIIVVTNSQIENLSFATCIMQLHVSRATKNNSIQHSLVAEDTCSWIRQVTKDNFSSSVLPL